MESQTLTKDSKEPETILEGFMLKQGSRNKQNFHERYFRLRSDNTLSYFLKEDDSEPKATLVLNELVDCEVSDLFVEKFNKELVYCVRITWAVDETDSQLIDSEFVDDSSSIGERHKPPTSMPRTPPPPERRRSLSADDQTPRAITRRSPFLGRKIFSKRATITSNDGDPPSQDNSATNTPRSVDNESLTIGTRRRLPPLVPKAPEEVEHIPSLVEVDERYAVRESGISTPPALQRSRSAYQERKVEEQEFLRAQYLSSRKENKKKFAQRAKLAAAASAAVGITAVTAGAGLLVGLALLAGAAAGGGGAAIGARWARKREGEMVIACLDYEKAKLLKNCLDAALESRSITKSTWGQFLATNDRKTRLALLPISREPERAVRSVDRSREVTVQIETNSKWRQLEGGWATLLGTGAQGLRIFREEMDVSSLDGTFNKKTARFFTQLSVDGKPCPAMKAHTVLNTGPLDAFLCLMSLGRMVTSPDGSFTPHSQYRSSFRVIESISDNIDVVHVVFQPLYLFPSWTSPRDFVLYRYWRLEQDGSYVVCFEPMQHRECPPMHGYVRGEMHQVFTIAPPKRLRCKRGPKSSLEECFITAVVQVDPKGWIPTSPIPFLFNQAYGDAFGVSALLQLLDVRDAIDEDRFVNVALDDQMQKELRAHSFDNLEVNDVGILPVRSSDSADEGVVNDDHKNYDFSYAVVENVPRPLASDGLCRSPPPLLPDKWAEPDSNSFRVRGKMYKVDKQKFNAGPSIGRLVAMDFVTVDKPIFSGFSTHPTERIQLALKREATLKEKGLPSEMPPFVFIVNISLPGPPYYHGVFYYAIDDMSTIDGSDGTPSSKLCSQFFFGDSDEFRDATFKLIPQIVQGNFVVRKAVGSTPAIMGKKLRQLYVKNERFFEVILDCGSSSVASGVIRFTIGYAKTLVVDMGFLFEGNDESTLPERIFGCVRVKHLEVAPEVVRNVKHPNLPCPNET